MKLRAVAVLFCFVLGFGASTKADSFNLVTANPVFYDSSLPFPPIPIHVSFEWDVTTDSPVFNTISVQGPEGPFLINNGFYGMPLPWFVNFTDAFGDDFQVVFIEPTSIPGSLDVPGNYGLYDTVFNCVPPLCPASAQNPFGEVLFIYATSGDPLIVSSVPASVPEPSTWLLLLVGMAVAFGALVLKRKAVWLKSRM